jgi:hypothetical protein
MLSQETLHVLPAKSITYRTFYAVKLGSSCVHCYNWGCCCLLPTQKWLLRCPGA